MMQKNKWFWYGVLILFAGCSKKGTTTPAPVPVVPSDPATAATIGFFMKEWSPKTFVVPVYDEVAKPAATPTVYVSIDAASVLTKVAPTVFAHNGNSWMSQVVTEPVLVNHLSKLKPGLIRFPGGSISDTYFWNATPGNTPADAPTQLPDANGVATATYLWVGKNTESWTISLDNYYALLQQTGNRGMITVNYGYARYGTGSNPVATAAHLAADWVRYDNGRTLYWEIGNENNGTWEAGYRINTAANHDGQPMLINGSLYGQHFKIFADSMRKAAQETGKTIYIGAQLLEAAPASWQTPADQGWNTGVLGQVANSTDFYIIHSYYTPYQTNAGPDEVLSTATLNTAAMMNYYKSTLAAAGAAVKPLALTEWNITSQGTKQQVSFVNGMHAAILLGEAIRNQYGETSRWDLANAYAGGNDHGLFNVGDEPGVSKWNPRPAFYYMYYFQQYMGDRFLNASVAGNLLAYPSSFTSGEKAVVLVNKGTGTETASISLTNTTPGQRYYWYTLTGGSDNGSFSAQVVVNGSGATEATGGPAGYATLHARAAATAGGILVTLPPRSVVYLAIDK